MSKPDGYRYVRAYLVYGRTPSPTTGTLRYALWEVQQGKRRRVGTATTEAEMNAFIGHKPRADWSCPGCGRVEGNHWGCQVPPQSTWSLAP